MKLEANPGLFLLASDHLNTSANVPTTSNFGTIISENTQSTIPITGIVPDIYAEHPVADKQINSPSSVVGETVNILDFHQEEKSSTPIDLSKLEYPLPADQMEMYTDIKQTDSKTRPEIEDEGQRAEEFKTVAPAIIHALKSRNDYEPANVISPSELDLFRHLTNRSNKPEQILSPDDFARRALWSVATHDFGNLMAVVEREMAQGKTLPYDVWETLSMLVTLKDDAFRGKEPVSSVFNVSDICQKVSAAWAVTNASTHIQFGYDNNIPQRADVQVAPVMHGPKNLFAALVSTVLNNSCKAVMHDDPRLPRQVDLLVHPNVVSIIDTGFGFVGESEALLQQSQISRPHAPQALFDGKKNFFSAGTGKGLSGAAWIASQIPGTKLLVQNVINSEKNLITGAKFDILLPTWLKEVEE